MKLDLSKNSDNLNNRLIYGFGGFFLMMGGMLWNGWTYGFVFFVICGRCLDEFYSLLKADGKRPLRYFGIVAGLTIYTLALLIAQNIISASYAFLIFPLFSLAFILKLYDQNDTQPFENVALTLLGMVYVAIPFACLNLATFLEGKYSYQVILGTFFLIWINDIGAYFIGSGYGKHKLFARISPKKSWEGSLGGLIMCILMVFLLSNYLPDLQVWQWAGVALVVVVVSTFGDLVESMFKRSISIKDSSNAIPGHGGFLDRFDGLLMAAPFIAVFLKIF
jgi:phosphatidate cytidylyltransferase